MDYRWKDLYISIMPGFCFVIYIVIAAYFADMIPIADLLSKDFVVKNGELFVLLIPMLSIAVGYFINGFSSMIEHHSYDNGCSIHPLADNKDTKFSKKDIKNKNKEISELLHAAKTILPPNKKVEEYYVRYAQARNMFYVHILFGFIILFVGFFSLICSIFCCSHFMYFWDHICTCAFFIQVIYHIFTGVVECWQYHHQLKRYEEVVRDECDYYKKESVKMEKKCPCFKM